MKLSETPASAPSLCGGCGSRSAPEESILAQVDEAPYRNHGEKDIEEIRFYLGHSMPEEAREAMVKLKQLKPDPATLAAVRAEVEAAIINAALAQDEISVAEEAETAPAQVASLSQPKAAVIKGFSDLRPTREPSIPNPQVLPHRSRRLWRTQLMSNLLRWNSGEFVSELEIAGD